jgi:AraC-like DNA-binding protein
VRRFTGLVGKPLLGYLTRWRTDPAAQRLRETNDATERFARDIGYSSEHAFSRAFTRPRGEPPGRYGRRASRP